MLHKIVIDGDGLLNDALRPIGDEEDIKSKIVKRSILKEASFQKLLLFWLSPSLNWDCGIGELKGNNKKNITPN